METSELNNNLLLSHSVSPGGHSDLAIHCRHLPPNYGHTCSKKIIRHHPGGYLPDVVNNLRSIFVLKLVQQMLMLLSCVASAHLVDS